MIMISKIDDEDTAQYDFVTCPGCKKGRLCDKPRGEKVSILQIYGDSLNHVVVKCPKCGSRYLVTASNK